MIKSARRRETNANKGNLQPVASKHGANRVPADRKRTGPAGGAKSEHAKRRDSCFRSAAAACSTQPDHERPYAQVCSLIRNRIAMSSSPGNPRLQAFAPSRRAALQRHAYGGTRMVSDAQPVIHKTVTRLVSYRRVPNRRRRARAFPTHHEASIAYTPAHSFELFPIAAQAALGEWAPASPRLHVKSSSMTHCELNQGQDTYHKC